jgi:DNA repair photolyase
MTTLYEPKGAAREYAALAFNMYKGCEHGCIYCYAPNATFKKREVFYGEVQPRKDVIANLIKDIKRLIKKGIKKEPVLLSFTCDPYQSLEKEHMLTKQAIQILNENGFPVRILTKAGKLAQRDLKLLSKNPKNEFGTSLTLSRKKDSAIWEPYAATPQERIDNLVAAKNQGLFTWVSLEPIIYTEQALDIIELTWKFVDFYGVGKLNYHKHQKSIDWAETREKIRLRLLGYKKNFMFHESLEKL